MSLMLRLQTWVHGKKRRVKILSSGTICHRNFWTIKEKELVIQNKFHHHVASLQKLVPTWEKIYSFRKTNTQTKPALLYQNQMYFGSRKNQVSSLKYLICILTKDILNNMNKKHLFFSQQPYFSNFLRGKGTFNVLLIC